MLLFSCSLKAIEEIDISDKAVAAAVNEAIECNTNVSVFKHGVDIPAILKTARCDRLIMLLFSLFLQEIIADAHHQNNINEYE